MTAPFVSNLTFLDQNYKLPAEQRAKLYSDYMRMRYTLVKKAGLSYEETGYLTQIERTNLMKFVSEDEEKRNEMYEKMNRNNN